MKRSRWLPAVAGLLLVAGCAPREEPAKVAEVATVSDEEMIRMTDDAFDAASNSKDVDALLALYTEDAIRMTPGEPLQAGRDAIARGFVSGFSTDSTTENDTLGVRIAGDTAIAWGTCRDTTVTEDGERVEPCKWITINKKQPDGSWKMARDIWNRDQPSAE